MLVDGFYIMINLIKSRTFKNVGFISISNIISNFFGMIIMILVARTLGPEYYGFLTIFFTIGFILSSIVNGVKTALVRKTSKKMNIGLVRFCFRVELVLALIFLVVGFLISKFVISLFKPDLHITIIFSLLYGFVLSLLGVVLGVFEAKQNFKYLSCYIILESIVRILMISLLYLFDKLTIINVYLVFVITVFIGFLISFFSTGINFIGESAPWKSVESLLKFAKWIILIDILLVFLAGVDIFIATYFFSMHEVGIYSAGKSFASKILILANSMIFVLFPKFSSLHKSQVRPYLKKVLKYCLLFIVVFLPGIFLSKFLIMITYGQSFLRTIPYFNVFYITFLISVIVSIFFIINYVIDKPQITFFLALLNLLVLVIFGILLVPVFGLMALAYISLFNVVISLLANWFVFLCIFIPDNNITRIPWLQKS